MTYTGEDGKDVHVRLMDQVKPYWRRLAIALYFPQHEIANMESKDDPVYYLLTEWLRGANTEKDSRPVTWRTFITALRDANIQEEATVLKNHFIQISKATSGELMFGRFTSYVSNVHKTIKKLLLDKLFGMASLMALYVLLVHACNITSRI